jgi:hypothetical protein
MLKIQPRDQAWRVDALCAQNDPEILFPDKGQTAATAKTPDTAEHTVTFEDDLDERGDS